MKSAFLVLSIALALASCGKPDDPSADSSSDGGSGPGSSASNEGDKPWDDTKKPYLTEKKMENFIASMKDPSTPFDAFEKGVTVLNAQSRLDEFDAAAKKHGFESGEEYLGSFSRIIAASVQVQTDETMDMMIKAQEGSIKSSEETLKKPDLTPEVRKMLEEQVKGAREALATYKQPRESNVNAQDIAAYKKHREEFNKVFAERSKKKE